MQDFEQLGVFYLGKQFDPVARKLADPLVLYDAKDLTTHAVIVGMTGSGKTGLGIGILEEAAIDGVPSIVIDPKGDLGNLLLAFPELRPEDFKPWVDDAEAVRRGMSVDAYAAETAGKWKKGLADWGQDGARVGRYKEAAQAVIYTPGSTAGIPLAILKSFSAPPQAVIDDAEALRERVVSTTSGLLTLLGVAADPVKSREHILLSNILEKAWAEGRDLDLAALIREIQTPPFDKLGVLDVESFFPAKERFGLATSLNGLVASPGFSAWTQGEPLDVQRLLWTADGKPRVAVLSIAHLSDPERMFFVTALLNEVIAWMRAQSGTSSLRALLYMDEVFGYFPPTANPPSKTPMLTLLKQARAFGLGVVLATQNPVDLDYKGLGNAGTWFLGRLQTERDKARVLDGLEGASAAAGVFDRARLDVTLSGLAQRTFLMVNAHDDAPTLFQTRWTLSYLRGPLTKPQIAALSAARKAAAPAAPVVPYGARVPAGGGAGAGAATGPDRGRASTRPMLPPDVPEFFLPPAGSGPSVSYRPTIAGSARVHYVDAKSSVDVWETLVVRAPLPDEMSVDPWAQATVETGEMPALEKKPVDGAVFAPLTPSASRGKTYAGWKGALEEYLYRTRPWTAWRYAPLKESSKPGESEGEFRARVSMAIREKRDAAIEDLRRRYGAKVAAAEDRIRTAGDRVAREKSQATQSKVTTALSWGGAILGAIFGRKLGSAGNIGRATTAAKGIGRASKEAQDVARAEESVEVLQKRLADLRAEIEAEVERLKASTDPANVEIVAVKVAPRKSDVSVGSVALVWDPSPPGA